MTTATVFVQFQDGVAAAGVPVWVYDAPSKTVDAYGTTDSYGLAVLNFTSLIGQTEFIALAQYNGTWYSDFLLHSGGTTIILPFNSGGGGTIPTSMSGLTCSAPDPSHIPLPSTVTFSGQLLASGVGLAGKSVQFQISADNGATWQDVGPAVVTASNGVFSLSLPFSEPYVSPNMPYRLRAYYAGGS